MAYRQQNTTYTKPAQNKTLSLDEWESNAPLGQTELGSVSSVRISCAQRRLPTSLNIAGNVHSVSRPSTPLAGGGPNRSKPVHPSLLHAVLSPSSLRSLPSTRPGTPPPGHPSQSGYSTPPALHISTAQQFYDWFSKLTASLEHEQDALYRDHLAEIAVYREACEVLIEECTDAERVCAEMEECFRFVEERSKSLQLACEELLEEQNRLLATSEALTFRLTYFSSLEPATRMLNSPGSHLVTNTDFLPTVDRMEECLAYLKAHRDYKDAELYILRYQQCLSRSMTLIKIYSISQFNSLGQDISKRIGELNLSETALQTLLYQKPRTVASHLRPLLLELEYRSTNHRKTTNRMIDPEAEDTGPSLSECQDAWLAVRQSLLAGIVRAEVLKLDPSSEDLVDLTRAGCGYLKRLCAEEYTLFRQFFETGDDRLIPFLETLCDYLYDYLRPRILHEPSLTVLCQVCTVLQALMVLDTIDDDDDEEENQFDTLSPSSNYFSQEPLPIDQSAVAPLHSPNHIRQNSYPGLVYSPSLSQRSFHSPKSRFYGNPGERAEARTERKRQLSSMLSPVLMDAQTRLVFRAQAVVQTSVGRFIPGEKDLDYPGKILAAKPVVSSRQAVNELHQEVENLNDLSEKGSDEDDDGALFRLPSREVQETWYPTLRKTLWVLEELHFFVDPAIFEDIAQEAILLCRQSLDAASVQISAKQGKADGALFKIRHLLILKEMMGSVEMIGKDLGGEMLGVTDAFSALLSSAMSFLPSALTFGYGGSTNATRSDTRIVDTKMDLDRSLKAICEDLITIASIASTAPLQPFISQASTFLAASRPSLNSSSSDVSRSKPTSNKDLGAQPWATPEVVLKLHDDVKEVIRKEVVDWVGKLRIYLEDGKAVDVLIPPMQSSIIESYRQFHEILRSEYDFSVSSVVWSPVKMWDFLREIVEPSTSTGRKQDA
ncbi:Subunit of cis-Golgi transport vesicle tethering complex-Sec34p [Phaffia rhodozyma]|uniref:Conserved oligomeric Golgi complex subunit 3 n=1 Tax=Phaffia rhodozyma TaxID=264483 RepID=A0A0F7STT3_PHARH|nr:Subunit of cis-Golgi transport vesicle tethering complex-Sec34p [Phaffia rhodozyma]